MAWTSYELALGALSISSRAAVAIATARGGTTPKAWAAVKRAPRAYAGRCIGRVEAGVAVIIAAQAELALAVLARLQLLGLVGLLQQWDGNRTSRAEKAGPAETMVVARTRAMRLVNCMVI
jgi:hypothetical protein